MGDWRNRQMGKWVWSDGSNWGDGYWKPGEPFKPVCNCLNCSYVFHDKWMSENCDKEKRFVCQLPASISIKSNMQLVFTSKNITMSALQFKWEKSVQEADIQSK